MSTQSDSARVSLREHGAAIGSFVVLLVAIGIWEVCSGLTFVIPDPRETMSVLITNLGDAKYLEHLAATATAFAWAFLLGTVLGAGIGLLLGLSRLIRNMFEPMVIGLNGVPKIVLYPLMLPIFHLGGSKIVMGMLFAVFPVLINVAAGVRDMPKVYWKLASSLNAKPWQSLISIVLPSIRGPLLTGIRLAVSLATVGVVLSEFFATKLGLGRVVLQAYGTGDYPSMIATILLLIAVAFIVSLLLWRVERRFQ